MKDSEDYTLVYRNDPRTTEELIRIALSKDPDADNDEYWNPIKVLQYRLPLAIGRLEGLVRSANPKNREVAATVLGQNSVKEKWDVSRCAGNLVAAIETEDSFKVLSSMIFALGHLEDKRVVDTVLPFTRHPNSDVRYATVHSLSRRDDSRAIRALVQLSSDEDFDVRNWATFGLGSMTELDTPEIRDALLNRLNEDDGEIRGEALVGLARRGDVRVATPLLNELANTNSEILPGWPIAHEITEAIIHTALDTGSSAWLPVLDQFRSLKIGNPDQLEAATAHCSENR